MARLCPDPIEFKCAAITFFRVHPELRTGAPNQDTTSKLAQNFAKLRTRLNSAPGMVARAIELGAAMGGEILGVRAAVWTFQAQPTPHEVSLMGNMAMPFDGSPLSTSSGSLPQQDDAYELSYDDDAVDGGPVPDAAAAAAGRAGDDADVSAERSTGAFSSDISMYAKLGGIRGAVIMLQREEAVRTGSSQKEVDEFDDAKIVEAMGSTDPGVIDDAARHAQTLLEKAFGGGVTQTTALVLDEWAGVDTGQLRNWQRAAFHAPTRARDEALGRVMYALTLVRGMPPGEPDDLGKGKGDSEEPDGPSAQATAEERLASMITAGSGPSPEDAEQAAEILRGLGLSFPPSPPGSE